MSETRSVSLALVKGSEREYIIKDLIGITLGRIYIVELDKENKYCLFRLKYYKNRDKSYDYLYDTLELMLISLFKNMGLNKVNVAVDEEVNTEPFIHIGFELEGFIQNSIFKAGEHKSELLFGIDAYNYENGLINRKLYLKGKNIELNVLTPEHAKEMTEYCQRNKEYLRPFEPLRDEIYYTIECQRRILMDSYKQFLNGKNISFGIFENNMLVGKIKISNIIMGGFRSATIGYSIDEQHQGKGYMKEAVRLVVKYAFEEMELHRIEASTLLDNVKSQKVLKANGFKELGMNEKYLFINGEWKDHIIFYKTK